MIETGHADTLDTTSLHASDLGLIVSGEVAYNHCHMYVGATTPDGRAEWITALDRLAPQRNQGVHDLPDSHTGTHKALG